MRKLTGAIWTAGALLTLLVVQQARRHERAPQVDPPEDIDAERPIAALDSVFMEELTWMEVRDAIRQGKTTAIVATGGIEQNGPYLATGKHNYVLEATTEAIARKLGDALVAPIVKFVPEGEFDPPSGHLRYPGTFSVRLETFDALLTDICWSLRQHGFENIVLLGDSGGNMPGLSRVAETLNRDWQGDPAVHFIEQYYTEDLWSYDFLKSLGIYQQPDIRSASRAEDHDDYHYTAIMMTVDPTTVRAKQRIAAGLFSVNGVPLSPASETIETGRKLVDYRAALTVAGIRESIAKSSAEQD